MTGPQADRRAYRQHLDPNGRLSRLTAAKAFCGEAETADTTAFCSGAQSKKRMDDRQVKRKLIGILSADVKEYSRLMGADEIGTLRTLKKYREIIAAIVRQHGGRVVDSPGDNMLAEFASVVDATRCAIEIQQKISGLNDQLPEDKKLRFRIGINLGDVIEDGTSIYGDGVNIAARLEALADADGICVSGSVYEQVKNKLPFDFEFLGDRSVKHISDPVRVYRVTGRKDAISPRAGTGGRLSGLQRLRSSKRALLTNVVITCAVMVVVMPFVNMANLNLLAKIWQCRLVLLPNSQKVTVVTIEPDEHRKMGIDADDQKPPPYLANPKVWRRYHPKVLKALQDSGAEAVGFDFWFSPAYDDSAKLATEKFVESLEIARKSDFPVVLGQAQNAQDPQIYNAADYGIISLQMDLTWLDKVMYLKSWDTVNIHGAVKKIPNMFVEAMAKKLRLEPAVDDSGVHLIGRRIPRRLWLAFAKTPHTAVSYHEIYHGWADESQFSGKIVLIGLCDPNTDYFKTPYSPRDFTPENRDDAYGMPGVFLLAHAINQVMNGYYHYEVNDEWTGVSGRPLFSVYSLESLVNLLLETILTCLVLYGAKRLIRKKSSVKLSILVMSTGAAALIAALAAAPPLFGLVNVLVASMIFTALTARRIDAGTG